jgi:hypothetical protein
MVDVKNLIQVIAFDRCSGQLTNSTIIEPENTLQTGAHISSCFSPNEELIYITHIADGSGYVDSRLYQYNLNDSVISNSRDTIFHLIAPDQFGKIQVGPDKKIYVNAWYVVAFPGYPYADSIRNATNENLSVINEPDSSSSACDFQPFSFYLAGKRTYIGLPNNPDYELGPLIGSGCDTLGVGTIQLPLQKEELHVFYHTGWQAVFINAEGLKGKKYLISIYDLMGKIVFREEGTLHSTYMKNLQCEQFAKGMYIVSLQTEQEKLVKRFVKN